MNKIIKLLASILLCLIVGLGGSIFTFKEIPGWYAGLQKPFFSPPNWIFGPVWTTLYILMGIAFYLIWIKGKKNKKAMIIFGWQLAANFLWSMLFFGMHSPALALVDIVALWTLIYLTIKEFSKISKFSAYLLYPYLAWVSFASLLNAAVWWLNR